MNQNVREEEEEKKDRLVIPPPIPPMSSANAANAYGSMQDVQPTQNPQNATGAGVQQTTPIQDVQQDKYTLSGEMEVDGNTHKKPSKLFGSISKGNWILTGILVVGIGVVGGLFFGKDENGDIVVKPPDFGLEEDAGLGEGGFEGLSKEEIQEKLNKQVEDGMINISMNTNPHIVDDVANVLIVNNEVNKHPQVVEIFIYEEDGSETQVYKSGLIPVGYNIETATFDVTLEDGHYDAIAYFNQVDGETGDLLGRAAAKIVIDVY